MQTPDPWDKLVEDIIRGCRLGPPLTPEQQAERLRLREQIAEFRRRYPRLAARLDAELDGFSLQGGSEHG